MIVTVKHNFETAHRLPFLPGKCQSIHGHSWQVEWSFDQDMDENGLTLEYGVMKRELRDWVDTYLDHGTMLGEDDKLLEAFRQDGSKVFVFGANLAAENLPWPTVEAVAKVLARVAYVQVSSAITCVYVQETAVNSAIWSYAADGL